LIVGAGVAPSAVSVLPLIQISSGSNIPRYRSKHRSAATSWLVPFALSVFSPTPTNSEKTGLFFFWVIFAPQTLALLFRRSPSLPS
jgi:hypothetical protein